MAELFASGRIVDLILVLMAAEAIVAVALYRRRGGRQQLASLLFYLASGACLLLALRFALIQGWWGWIALCLSAAFIVHLTELRRRLGEKASRSSTHIAG
jgi:hypothetical protein